MKKAIITLLLATGLISFASGPTPIQYNNRVPVYNKPATPPAPMYPALSSVDTEDIVNALLFQGYLYQNYAQMFPENYGEFHGLSEAYLASAALIKAYRPSGK